MLLGLQKQIQIQTQTQAQIQIQIQIQMVKWEVWADMVEQCECCWASSLGGLASTTDTTPVSLLELEGHHLHMLGIQSP